ncbi:MULTISPECIES: hypothetical protein [Chelativorans]|uniref:Uncharacterized protein n=1 Tax=Chelativorans sp. (strain BNC1) TaxID=266779 RepID=Q11F45_CHESB|nr:MULTISPECIES: hypothetical protein [Chelativorans]
MPKLQEILLLVGQLNYTWTNTESLLIYLIGGLAGVDKETAIVVFLTLNTTRARIDLVERLAKMQKTPPECRADILQVTGRLSKEAVLRNKFNHCIYSFDPESGRGITQLMRIFESRDEIKYGKVESLDERELARIRKSIASLIELNKTIWAVARKYEFPIS